MCASMLIEGSALITGASRGIGRVIAMRLAAQGLAIGVNYRERHSEAESVVEAIQSAGGKAVAIQADVASDDEVAGLVDRAEEALGPLSIVVNNAGITRDRLLIQMSEADWLDIWRTDLAGTRTVCRAAEKRMVPRRAGRIINVSSVVGTGGNAGQANYAAAKAAVLGLTREFAVRCAPSGVTVNCVVPGYIDTDATSQLTVEQREVWLRRIPMRRYATPEEVAEIVVFLAGDGAGYITGQCIAVDGGYMAAAGAGLAS